MKKLLFVILFICTNVFADEVIDLGSLEVDGEVRRPMINYSSTGLNMVKAMNHQLKSERRRYIVSLSTDNHTIDTPSSFEFSDVRPVEGLSFELSPLKKDM